MSQLENSPEKEKTQKFEKGEFADFKIINEEWDIHKIEDGSLLRSRILLSGIMIAEKNLGKLVTELKAGNKQAHALTFRTRQFFEIEPPPSLRGSPDSKAYQVNELKSCIVDEDMDFKTVRQSWNIYELENGIKIKLRLSITSISKTNKFDGHGMPIYTIDSSIEGKTELPDSLETLVEGKKLKMAIKKSNSLS